MRIFADEDVYKELEELLIELGHDVVSPIDLGIRGAGDELCFIHAATDSRVIVTHNEKDFSLLHRAWLTWPGHWRIDAQPRHQGVLSVPQLRLMQPELTANRIDGLLRDHSSLTNTFYRLTRSGRWTLYR